MKRARAYTSYASEAAALLGARVREERLRRRWSEQELADRIGATRGTVARVERGDMGVSVGLAFEAATILGIPLFEPDAPRLTAELGRAHERLALMPRRAMPRREVLDDDF